MQTRNVKCDLTDEQLLQKAKDLRNQSGNKFSVSLMQRRFCIGYTRAARVVDQLEDAKPQKAKTLPKYRQTMPLWEAAIVSIITMPKAKFWRLVYLAKQEGLLER